MKRFPLSLFREGERKSGVRFLQQTTSFDVHQKLYYNGMNAIHRSAMGFIVCTRELKWGTTSGIINADQTEWGRGQREEGVG